MTLTLRSAAAGALALALAACGVSSKPDPYLQNLPDAAALTVDTSASASTPAAALAMDPAPVTTAGDDLGVVHRKAEAMNDAIRDVFAHVTALTASGGTLLTGSVKQWGPAVRCVEPDPNGGCVPGGEAKLLLRSRRWTDHLGDFVVLATSVAGSSADYRPVLAGYLIRGAVDHRGAGKIWVNHENLLAAAPGFRGRGYLAAGFAAGPVAKVVKYRMLGFTRDSTLHAPITAAFSAWKNGAGIVRARVADLGELYANPTGGADAGRELGFWHGVWAPGASGRAYTVITDFWDPQAATTVGDVPAGKYWFARACYPAGATVPSYKEWFECDRVADATPRQCVLNAPLDSGSHQGTPDPTYTTYAHWSQTSCYWNPLSGTEPDELAPPGAAPGNDANDDVDEDGASHVGLMPEPVPTTATGIMNPDPTPPGMVGPGMGGMM